MIKSPFKAVPENAVLREPFPDTKSSSEIGLIYVFKFILGEWAQSALKESIAQRRENIKE